MTKKFIAPLGGYVYLNDASFGYTFLANKGKQDNRQGSQPITALTCTTYTYDGNGSLSSETDGNGKTAVCSYDTAGRMSRRMGN